MERLIKSKERVRKHGEVFTPSWVVKRMCDMLQENNREEDVFRIDSTFLEPSCGTGNFLVEIFERKLDRCHSAEDGLTAIASIFGIDIMADNIQESRARLKQMYIDRFGPVNLQTVDEIMGRNMVCGNMLTKLDSNGEKIWFLNEGGEE